MGHSSLEPYETNTKQNLEIPKHQTFRLRIYIGVLSQALSAIGTHRKRCHGRLDEPEWVGWAASILQMVNASRMVLN